MLSFGNEIFCSFFSSKDGQEVIGGSIHVTDGGCHSTDGGWRLTDAAVTRQLALCGGSSVPRQAVVFFPMTKCREFRARCFHIAKVPIGPKCPIFVCCGQGVPTVSSRMGGSMS